MQTKYFEIDFFKFVLVVAMVFRHSPLYIYDKNIVEYSISHLDIYTLFIPVTSGFVFVLGYTLGLSFIHKINNVIEINAIFKYIKLFGLFLFLSIFFGVITWVQNDIETSFIDYFLGYIWNTTGKPGFYILFPISLIYLVNYIQYFLKLKYFVELLSVVVFFTLYYFNDLYFLHYFLFGLIGYVIGLKINFQKIKEKINIYVLLISLVLYIGIYFIGYTNNINLFFELYLLLFLFVISIGLSKHINLEQYKRLKSLILISSKNILPFYILHVIGLQIISNYIKLESLYIVCVVSVLYYLIVMGLIHYTRRVLQI